MEHLVWVDMKVVSTGVHWSPPPHNCLSVVAIMAQLSCPHSATLSLPSNSPRIYLDSPRHYPPFC